VSSCVRRGPQPRGAAAGHRQQGTSKRGEEASVSVVEDH
jgi:hypothetical protein